MILVILLLITSPKSDEYEYVFDKSNPRLFSHVVGDLPCNGFINESGLFVPDIKDLEKNLQARKNKEWAGGLSMPPPFGRQMRSNEPVYEYRSGILVPMIMDDKRGIIPEVGGKIIDFKDYHYSPTARRIYNLPGRFVLKKEVPAKKP